MIYKLKLKAKKNKETKIKEILQYFNIDTYDLNFIWSRAEHEKYFILEVKETESRFYHKSFIGSVALDIKNKTEIRRA